MIVEETQHTDFIMANKNWTAVLGTLKWRAEHLIMQQRLLGAVFNTQTHQDVARQNTEL